MHLESICANSGSAAVSDVSIVCYSQLPPTKYRICHWHFAPVFEFQALRTWYRQWYTFLWNMSTSTKKHRVFTFLYPRSPKGEGGILFYLCPSVLPSVQDIFRRIFLSNCRWQKSDIWSQASYRYTILWVAFLEPSDSYFLFAALVGSTQRPYMQIFLRLLLSNYLWQKFDIWSQASYRYPIS